MNLKSIRIPFRIPIVVKVLAGLVILGLGIGIAAIQYFSRDLPSTARLEMIEPSLKTRVFAADSSLVGEYYIEDRALVSLEDIPQYLIDAIVATEDRKFYDHWGVDLMGIARAVWVNMRSGSREEGGSTITQQLARNLFDMFESSYTRKIKEALLATRIERSYSKDEILEMYLNQIYFGSGAHGVEAAARTFFNKSVRELTMGEATLIAGLPKNPRDYSPLYNLDRALKRREAVLISMVDAGYIAKGTADSIRAEEINPMKTRAEKSDYAAYFLEEVRKYLERRYGSDRIYHDGLRVYTDLDPKLQRIAEDSMEVHLQQMEVYKQYTDTKAAYDTLLAHGEEVGAPNYLQSAAVALDVETGYVKALVGGRSFKQSKFNRATQAKRQPGSAFKPFIYLAAMENGYTPADILLDAPVVLDLPNGDVWKPRNFTERFEGEVSLRHSLDFSINIAAIRLLMALGPQSAINYARSCGIESNLEPVYSLALGVSEVSLTEITNAYSTIAAGGMRGDWFLVKRVEDRDGNILEDNQIYREEVIDPQTNFMITSLLESVVNEGYGRGSRAMGFKGTAAGKTGTTDGCTDAWFVGFTPEIAVGVWSGFDRKKPMGKAMTGARVSLPLWTDIMAAYYEDRPSPRFKRPSGITESVVCEDTGLLVSTNCRNVRREVFVEGTQPRRSCDRHDGVTRQLDGASFDDIDRALTGGD